MLESTHELQEHKQRQHVVLLVWGKVGLVGQYGKFGPDAFHC